MVFRPEQFTEQAQETLAKSQEIVRRYQHSQWDLEHILMALLEQEHLRVMLLNTKNEVLAIREVYVGNVNSSMIRVAEVLRPAVRDNCPAIIENRDDAQMGLLQ